MVTTIFPDAYACAVEHLVSDARGQPGSTAQLKVVVASGDSL